MAGGETRVETINELKIWLEGEFKLIRSTQDTNADEMRTLRKVVHDLAGHVQVIMAQDVPGKIESLKNEVQKHDGDIATQGKELAGLKNTMRTAYVSVGIAGAVVGSIITLLLRAYEVLGG